MWYPLIVLALIGLVLIIAFLIRRTRREAARGVREADRIEISDDHLTETKDELVPVEQRRETSDEDRPLPRVVEEDIFEETSYFKEFSFELREGEVVEGPFKELGGSTFKLYILDQENFRNYSEGARFTAQQMRVAVSRGELEFRAPFPGTWYVVFELNRKRREQTVHADLKKRKPGMTVEPAALPSNDEV